MKANFDHAEVQAAVIQQEWESFRYQDGLRWSKIQTITAIEVAFIAGVYAAPKTISAPMLIALAVLVTLIVAAICALAEKDGRDAKYHLNRAEALLSLTGLGVDVSKPVFALSGHHTMRLAMVFLNLLNFTVVVELISRCRCA